jgi:hypothetical protein
MEASFVIELILSLIFVAGIALKTLRDLRVRYPCHSSACPHEDEEDSCALPACCASAVRIFSVTGSSHDTIFIPGECPQVASRSIREVPPMLHEAAHAMAFAQGIEPFRQTG